MTLRIRLTLAMFVAGAVLVGGFATVVFVEAKRQLVGAADAVVRDHLQHALDSWSSGESVEEAARQVAHETIAGANFLVDGKMVRRGFQTSEPIALVSLKKVVRGRELEVQGLANSSSTSNYLIVLRGVLFLITFLTVALLAPVAWFAAGRVLAPFARLAFATGQLDARSLKFRFPVPRPKDEYRTLVEAFNALLARLSKAFDALHLFSAQVSHELRTPVAAILARTEETPTAAAFESIAGDARRMAVLTDQLLTLAQATHLSDSFATHSAELWDFLAGLLDMLEPRTRSRQCSVFLQPSETAIEVDTVLPLLDVAVTNLIENASRYGGPNVYVSVREEGDVVFLVVEDDGKGLCTEKLSRVGEAFVRYAGPDKPGSGLGLTIVHAAVDVLGGTLTLSRSVYGGLRAELCFAKVFATLRLQERSPEKEA